MKTINYKIITMDSKGDVLLERDYVTEGINEQEVSDNIISILEESDEYVCDDCDNERTVEDYDGNVTKCHCSNTTVDGEMDDDSI